MCDIWIHCIHLFLKLLYLHYWSTFWIKAKRNVEVQNWANKADEFRTGCNRYLLIRSWFIHHEIQYELSIWSINFTSVALLTFKVCSPQFIWFTQSYREKTYFYGSRMEKLCSELFSYSICLWAIKIYCQFTGPAVCYEER